jgi:hypothetical protein
MHRTAGWVALKDLGDAGLEGEALADITILANPAQVVGVWKAGRRVKSPRSDLTEHH